MAYVPYPSVPGSGGGGGGGLGPNTVGSSEIIDGSIATADIDEIAPSKVTGLEDGFATVFATLGDLSDSVESVTNEVQRRLTVRVWDGDSYEEASDRRIFIGPEDPESPAGGSFTLADGDLWQDTTEA